MRILSGSVKSGRSNNGPAPLALLARPDRAVYGWSRDGWLQCETRAAGKPGSIQSIRRAALQASVATGPLKTLLLTLTAVAGILAQAWGQSSAVRYDNATKAVTAPIPFRVGQSAVDPTAPGNGSIWYDTATNTLEARINGATVSLGTTITGLDTRVMFFDGANNPAGDAGMTYNKTTDTLTVPNLDVSTLASDLTIDGDLTVNAVTMTGTLALPDNVRQTLNPGAIVAGLNVGSFAGNPSTPINGDIWYDSTANTLDAQIAGVTVNLGGVSLGADNTWTGTNAFGVLSSLGATSFTPANANVTLSPDGDGIGNY